MFALALMIALADPPKADPLAPWTPLPVVGKAESWQKMGEKDWQDDRLQKMDTGPFFNATFKYKKDGKDVMVYKGTAIKLGDKGGMILNRENGKIECAWTGGFLKMSSRRFALLNTPEPEGKPITSDKSVIGHEITGAYKGLSLHGDQVTIESEAGERHYNTFQLAPNGKVTWQSSETRQEHIDSPKRWGEPIITKFVKGNDSNPFAIDTLTIPYKNRFNALFFCTGLDFLPDGRIAVCTAHGDVWLVTVDEVKETCSWQRYATGLYQPLGLKVVDGKVVVIERGQLTRLHDDNNDGEADYYENINSDWHLSGGEHSYNTCLETDPEGNFYFFATGDTDTPTGGSLIKISADGSKIEKFATGFRHPIGLGMSPEGIITGADQQGNWMPATRIDEFVKGGFYGDMRAHHRKVPPTIYDGPLCWVPHEVDNSAGGQVWVPKGTWGELGGLPLHFSYGHCNMFVLLRQTLKDHPTAVSQGGVWDLGLQYLAGVCR